MLTIDKDRQEIDGRFSPRLIVKQSDNEVYVKLEKNLTNPECSVLESPFKNRQPQGKPSSK
jgi:hypothetical protein